MSGPVELGVQILYPNLIFNEKTKGFPELQWVAVLKNLERSLSSH